MIRSKFVVVASLLLLVLVTGCNNEDQSNEPAAPTPVAVKKKPKAPKAKASPGATPTGAEPTATASPGKAKAAAPGSAKKAKQSTAAAKTDVKGTLGKLNGYLPAAVKALQADDIETAKQYAQAFNANWKQKIIQNSVKTQSQDSYKKISAGVTQVNKLMQSATPDKDKAIASLQSLSQAVQEYAKTP